MIQKNEKTSEIRDRLREFIVNLGISERQFEMNNKFYNGFVGKVNKLDDGKIAILEKAYPELNISWLLTGEGEMLKKEIVQKLNGDSNVAMFNYLSKNNLSVVNNDIVKVLQEQVQYLQEQNKTLLEILKERK